MPPRPATSPPPRTKRRFFSAAAVVGSGLLRRSRKPPSMTRFRPRPRKVSLLYESVRGKVDQWALAATPCSSSRAAPMGRPTSCSSAPRTTSCSRDLSSKIVCKQDGAEKVIVLDKWKGGAVAARSTTTIYLTIRNMLPHRSDQNV